MYNIALFISPLENEKKKEGYVKYVLSWNALSVKESGITLHLSVKSGLEHFSPLEIIAIFQFLFVPFLSFGRKIASQFV